MWTSIPNCIKFQGVILEMKDMNEMRDKMSHYAVILYAVCKECIQVKE
jgi:hypothetical protein